MISPHGAELSVPGEPTSTHDPLEGVGDGGVIVTGARLAHLAPAFMPVIERAIERVAQVPGDHTLCVYGSVATGTARVGRSDVDLMTIGLDPALAARLGQDLSAEFAQLCRGVEVGAAQADDFAGPGDEAHGNRVFLRHYCVHLSGQDAARGLHDFAADQAAARGFNGDIGQCAMRWRQQALAEPPAPQLGRRVARKTLLAVAGLVSMHDAGWSTDRIRAAWRWGQIQPGWAPALNALVHWCDHQAPPPSRDEVQRGLDGVVAHVVQQFDSRIGLWP